MTSNLSLSNVIIAASAASIPIMLWFKYGDLPGDFKLLSRAKEIIERRKLICKHIDGFLTLEAPYGVIQNGVYERYFMVDLHPTSAGASISFARLHNFNMDNHRPKFILEDGDLWDDLIVVHDFYIKFYIRQMDKLLSWVTGDAFNVQDAINSAVLNWRRREVAENNFGIPRTISDISLAPEQRKYYTRIFTILRDIEKMALLVSQGKIMGPTYPVHYINGPQYAPVIEIGDDEYGITVGEHSVYVHTPAGIFEYKCSAFAGLAIAATQCCAANSLVTYIFKINLDDGGGRKLVKIIYDVNVAQAITGPAEKIDLIDLVVSS